MKRIISGFGQPKQNKSDGLNFKKRIFQRILANFIKVVPVNEWMILAENNVNIYQFFKYEVPDLFYKFKGDGLAQGLKEDEIVQWITEESVREMLQNNLPNYLTTLDNSNHLGWLRNQLEYLVTEVF